MINYIILIFTVLLVLFAIRGLLMSKMATRAKVELSLLAIVVWAMGIWLILDIFSSSASRSAPKDTIREASEIHAPASSPEAGANVSIAPTKATWEEVKKKNEDESAAAKKRFSELPSNKPRE
jgi:hypothetical protein